MRRVEMTVKPAENVVSERSLDNVDRLGHSTDSVTRPTRSLGSPTSLRMRGPERSLGPVRVPKFCLTFAPQYLHVPKFCLTFGPQYLHVPKFCVTFAPQYFSLYLLIYKIRDNAFSFCFLLVVVDDLHKTLS